MKVQDKRQRILNVSLLCDFPDARITEIQEATENDPELQRLKQIIIQGWPEKECL